MRSGEFLRPGEERAFGFGLQVSSLVLRFVV